MLATGLFPPGGYLPRAAINQQALADCGKRWMAIKRSINFATRFFGVRLTESSIGQRPSDKKSRKISLAACPLIPPMQQKCLAPEARCGVCRSPILEIATRGEGDGMLT